MFFQFQTLFMEKDLLKLDNEQCDDDFEKMFQGFLDDELSSDDSDTDDENTNDGETNDDEDHAPRFGGERHYMPEITKVKILVQPHLFDSVYVNGDIAVTLYGKKGSHFADERFQLNILA